MRVQSILPLLCAPLLAFAQSNPFKIPPTGLAAKGGQALNLEWTPTTNGTVSLILRSGNAANLAEGTTIASNIANSGAYTWTPSNSITTGSDYTVEIVDDTDPNLTNYTPYFTLDTPTTASQTTSMVTLGAPSTSGGKTRSAKSTGSSSSSSSSSGSPSVTSSSSSASPSGLTTATSASPTPTGAASSAASTSPSSPTATGAAAKMNAMAAGVFGLALGALAL
ncbi:Ser-Thr-rich glycosyl-phosphatidyl-inositol-anchored membrane family-domain-containing protein [Neohortaea acidophila]|uniref:Ser-Thr-rich glycosyl-phosphatidyl-inositol-anchored membrane family-domain-containing protein n=1 Tax=Neohortaea acidophila TaxID=245834 RepID=A0A6A6PKZ3_9PEZI|nr:Ser-Thr-rich glycosyl-phosphatidyl-inositol-anchored membrane family-domain-containing protein [Neohortaea acidophila]KAF2480476.1 Ser-Thr-rich glycosyl-phosphatidyl-inositol-anchored membrane family-domain-containing protein [Neohortaea acidophila]